MDKTEKLLTEIKRYNELYRAGNTQISDKEYDKLVKELKRIDPENEWFKHIEPAPVSKRRKVKLPVPMKSLNKVKDIKSLLNWAESIGLTSSDYVIITPKFDGLSLLHNEKTGKAYSRGGAENEGQDCSAHYKAATKIVNVKTPLAFTFGELVFSHNSWMKHFYGKAAPDTGDKYKSPRNTAAGLLNRDEPSENLMYVDFFRYGIDEVSLENFLRYEDIYLYLCKTFSQPELFLKVTVGELTTELCLDLYKKWMLQYYIDGLVIYANEIKVWDAVGRQGTTGNPNYAIAYKDPSFTETFETVVNDITWKVSKSGALKPVVNIETVDTGDCNMENPTGYNAKWVYEHRIAKGAEIIVTRSGGVIPKILETVKPASTRELQSLWKELSHCPHCQSPTEWNGSGIELMCTNPKCDGIKLAKIVFFFKTVEAEQMGEETITKMFNAGYTSIKMILNITFDELLEIDGFGEGIANQILDATNKIKQGIEITKLMHASDCFTGIGQVKAKTILSQLSIENLNAFYNGRFHTWANNEELKSMKFFQETNTTLQSFALGIIPFYEFIAENRLLPLPMESRAQDIKGDSCEGLKVCFTGVRDPELEQTIRTNSGEVVSGVSKKTTHLIVADKDSTSTKAEKARQLGIPIMTIDEFKSRFLS